MYYGINLQHKKLTKHLKGVNFLSIHTQNSHYINAAFVILNSSMNSVFKFLRLGCNFSKFFTKVTICFIASVMSSVYRDENSATYSITLSVSTFMSTFEVICRATFKILAARREVGICMRL